MVRLSGTKLFSDVTQRKCLLSKPTFTLLASSETTALSDVFLGIIFKDMNVTSVLQIT